MRQLLAVLGSKLLRKWYIFNFKSVVSRSITGFQYFGNFQKNQKNTRIQQNFKKYLSLGLSFFFQPFGFLSARVSKLPTTNNI